MEPHEKRDADEACRRVQDVVTWIVGHKIECRATMLNAAAGSIMLTAYWSQPEEVREKWLAELLGAVRDPKNYALMRIS